MGGPWKIREFDPRSWQPPVPRVEARLEVAPTGEIGVVIVYIASVLVTVAVMLALMRQGW